MKCSENLGFTEIKKKTKLSRNLVFTKQKSKK